MRLRTANKNRKARQFWRRFDSVEPMVRAGEGWTFTVSFVGAWRRYSAVHLRGQDRMVMVQRGVR